MLKVKYAFDESNIYFTFALSFSEWHGKDNSKGDGADALSIMFPIAKLAVLLLFSKFIECNFRK